MKKTFFAVHFFLSSVEVPAALFIFELYTQTGHYIILYRTKNKNKGGWEYIDGYFLQETEMCTSKKKKSEK